MEFMIWIKDSPGGDVDVKCSYLSAAEDRDGIGKTAAATLTCELVEMIQRKLKERGINGHG